MLFGGATEFSCHVGKMPYTCWLWQFFPVGIFLFTYSPFPIHQASKLEVGPRMRPRLLVICILHIYIILSKDNITTHHSTHPRDTTIAPNSSNTCSSHNKQTNKQCNNIAQEALCKCIQATLHSASCTAKIALQPLHISVPSTKWVDYTECWF